MSPTIPFCWLNMLGLRDTWVRNAPKERNIISRQTCTVSVSYFTSLCLWKNPTMTYLQQTMMRWFFTVVYVHPFIRRGHWLSNPWCMSAGHKILLLARPWNKFMPSWEKIWQVLCPAIARLGTSDRGQFDGVTGASMSLMPKLYYRLALAKPMMNCQCSIIPSRDFRIIFTFLKATWSSLKHIIFQAYKQVICTMWWLLSSSRHDATTNSSDVWIQLAAIWWDSLDVMCLEGRHILWQLPPWNRLSACSATCPTGGSLR